MYSSPIIRPASLHESQDLRDIKVRVSLMWPDYRRLLLDDPDWTHIDERGIAEGRVLVIEAQGETVGFCTVQPRADGDSEVHSYFVDPGHWGGEAPRRLMDAAAAFAKSEGSDHLWASTTESAVFFYESLGFERMEDVDGEFDGRVCLLRPLYDTVGNA